MGDGTTPVPGLPGLAPVFLSKKGKNTSTVVLSSIGAMAAAWPTSLVPPTTPRKMCLLGLCASLGAGPQPGTN